MFVRGRFVCSNNVSVLLYILHLCPQLVLLLMFLVYCFKIEFIFIFQYIPLEKETQKYPLFFWQTFYFVAGFLLLFLVAF